MRRSSRTIGILLLSLAAACGPGEPEVVRPGSDTDGATVEYVAHASIIIEATDGTRVLIDPYNGSKWIGYSFPPDLDVDAVLITHPHYDHDAAWNLPPGTPVYREPGTTDIGPIRVIGVEGEHSGGQRYRDRGVEPYNVVWVVDVGGLRFVHTGDNGLPTADVLEAVGPTDVLFTTPFFPVDSIEAAWMGNGLKVVTPVHTRLPDLAVPEFRLPTSDEWLRGKRPIRDVGNRVRYTAQALDGGLEYHVLSPSEAVQPWSRDLIRAWQLSASAGADGILADSALTLHAAAARLGANAMTLQVRYAQALVEAERGVEAQERLVSALANEQAGDVEQRLRAHALLGGLLQARGDTVAAQEHFAVVLADSRTYASDAVAAARR